MKNQEDKEVFKKALFFTNAAYLVIDILNSFIKEADYELNKIHKCFNREDKQKMNIAANSVKSAYKATKYAARNIYQIEEVDDACNDSDYLYEILKMVINRTDDTEESKQRMIEHIRQLPKVEQEEVGNETA